MAHVSLITLGVDDLDRSRHFYESLGWRRSDASVDGVIHFMRGGALVLGLFGHADLAEDAGVTNLGTPPAGIALAMNVASEDDVDQVLAVIPGAGGAITKPATRAEWGGYLGYFTDPDGHLWEVAYNPGFPLNTDGSIRLPDEG